MKYLNIVLSVFIIIFLVQCSTVEHKDHGHHHDHDQHHAHDQNKKHSGNKAIHDESKGHLTDTSGYTILKIEKQPFSFTLRTGGRITVDSRDIIMVTSKSSGVVHMNDDYLFPGVEVSKGDILFTISGAQLAEGNTELNFRHMKADLDRASANYERAKRLIEDRIITEVDFLTAKNEYEKLLNSYENLSATAGRNGNNVTAVTNGFIKEIFVVEGEKVNPGDLLASLVLDHNLVLKADVSPDKIAILSSVSDANFSVSYSDKLYKLSNLNGRKISQGKSTGSNSYYIPLYFRMDYTPELIDGTFAEVYLIGNEIKDAIVVPNTALMEEYGKIYVFIADEGGDFVKRYVEPGYSDGQRTMIFSGLSEGERIVATGTYRIKLMQMTTTAPSHSHNH